MTQATLMWKLRIKIDVWSQGLDESLRERNRKLLIEAYLRLPPRRVWHFVKHIRVVFLSKSLLHGLDNEPYDPIGSSFQEPEDTIARGKYSPSIAYLVY